MEILSVALTALVSVVVLFVLVKIIGNRAISQMNMFDYINSITIGSIAAELATSDVDEMTAPLVAMIVYTAAVIIIAWLATKSLTFRRIVEGRTVILFKGGKLFDKNFKKAKIDINEFFMQCRLNGYFNLDDIEAAVQESNGRLSILPKASAQPVTPKNLNLAVNKNEMYFNIVLDGKILEGNLKNAGFNKQWLEKQMKNNNVSDIKNVFAAICSAGGDFYVYENQERRDKRDVFDS